MLVWILDVLFARQSADPAPDVLAGADFLIVRAVAGFVCAVLVTLFAGPIAICRLREKFRERVDSASDSLNRLHAGKSETPTMGGIIIVVGVTCAALVCVDLSVSAVWIALATMIAFAGIGFADDFVKATTQRRGLSIRQKLFAQLLVAGCCGGALSVIAPANAIPPSRLSDFATTSGVAFVLWAMFVLVTASNSVNLSDGLDGLASGCGAIAALVVAVACGVAFHRAADAPFQAVTGEMAVLAAALAGALVGFLYFNRHPARIFMGDTGSLSIGALLGVIGIAARQEFVVAIACGVFLLETGSVVAQVGWFKTTGSRLIRCSPLHNHFVLAGHAESRVVSQFWLAGVGCAFAALACLWLSA